MQVPRWFAWVSKWYLHGLNGPFGSVNSLPEQAFSIFYNNNKEQANCTYKPVPPNLYPSKSSVQFRQNDVHNCGVCCMFFMFDLIISQSTVSWKAPLNEDGSLPPTITFGTSVLTTSDFKNLVQNQDGLQQHLNSLYQLF